MSKIKIITSTDLFEQNPLELAKMATNDLKITHLCAKDLFARWVNKNKLNVEEKWISQNINFEVSAGEILAIMGPSGSGKSTLIQALLGLVPYRKGSIQINGKDVTSTGLKCVSSRVGLVPQDDVLVDELTVHENIHYFHKIAVDSNLSDADLNKRISVELERLNITKAADSRIGKISGGQRKRANIAMELINDPDILIIDEPTSGLSSQDSLELIKNLRKISDSGKIVIIIIHQPSSDIFHLFNRLLVLDGKGNCIRSGKTTEVMAWFESTNEFHGEAKCNSCGSSFPDKLLSAVESGGDWGQPAKLFGEHFATTPPVAETKIPRNRLIRSPIESMSDILTLIKRQLLIKTRDRMSQIVTFAAPPILGLLLASVFKAAPEGMSYSINTNALYPQAIFMLIIGSMFLGMVSSVFEVIKDRPILKREVLRGLSPIAYYVSEIVTLAIIGAIQAASLVFFASISLGVMDLFGINFVVIYLVMLISMATGLLLSTLFNSPISAYNLIPLILIPQIILGGALLPYKDMGKEIYLGETRDVSKRPQLAKLMPASWAYQMAMRMNYEAMHDENKKSAVTNMAVMELEFLKYGSFLSPQAEYTLNDNALNLLPKWDGLNKPHIEDEVMLLMILVGLFGTGAIWIRRDFTKSKFSLWIPQSALLIALPFAHGYLMTKTHASETPERKQVAEYIKSELPSSWHNADSFCKARQSSLATIDESIAIFNRDEAKKMQSGYYWTSESSNENKYPLVWVAQLTNKTSTVSINHDRQSMLKTGALKKTKRLQQKLHFICITPPK
ncbi:MAG: ATP-binding cassette domain-containing protein [Methylotenera sp.]|nr:ATP-binding cassette domain-containing protein [Methylotenera sp.]